MRQLVWRQAVVDDQSFLRLVYASTRADELAMAGWDEAMRASFVDMQFQAQQRHYLRHFPDSVCSVIEADGVPVGRLWVDRRAASIHLLDIALLPESRCQGLGSACLRRLMDEAGARRVPLTLQVEHANPARRLYERLGFEAGEEHGLHLGMAWCSLMAAECKEMENEQA